MSGLKINWRLARSGLTALFASIVQGGSAAFFVAPALAQATPPPLPNSSTVGSSRPGLGIDFACREEPTMGVSGNDCWLTVDGYDPAFGPVTVKLPGRMESIGSEYGLHANGLVLINLEGDREPQDGGQALPILHFNFYACEAVPFNSEMCRGFSTKPGTQTVPVLITQAGHEPTDYTIEFEVKPPVVDRDQTQYRLGNRQHISHFLDIRYGPLESGEILVRRGSAVWYLETIDLDASLFRLRSAWSPDEYLAVKDGKVDAYEADPESPEAHWKMSHSGATVPHGNFFRFQNVDTGLYLNVEDDRTVTVRALDPELRSEQWWLLY
jgi:hypothetical protein